MPSKPLCSFPSNRTLSWFGDSRASTARHPLFPNKDGVDRPHSHDRGRHGSFSGFLLARADIREGRGPRSRG